MRSLDNYDRIYCDIDGTLIYGWFTDFMDFTWRVFHNKILAQILMTIQANLGLYKVNKLLAYMLISTKAPVLFLTARGMTDSTLDILTYSIGMYGKSCKLAELETDNPEVDKMIYIASHLDEYPVCCLFDDNKDTLREVGNLDVDTFDATAMYERSIK